MQTPKPTLELLTCDAAYRENPTALFHQVCGDRPATLLLESADIDSKDDLKSLLLVDSALRITALGDTVTIQALSDNGASLLPLLDTALPAGVENDVLPAGRVLRFPPVSPLLDEDARLCSLSVFDAFRLLQGVVNIPTQEREAMFFGGLFAYDLVAGFEALPHLEAGNKLPGLLLLFSGNADGYRSSEKKHPYSGQSVHRQRPGKTAPQRPPGVP
ncbi:Anthranilate synthase component 1 [Salmonella enterica subsp. enterica serovar Typhimurium]|nr:Anthranilate synthase component 1 [Salmonella enterica subsp. enterica serovar Typhimurium]